MATPIIGSNIFRPDQRSKRLTFGQSNHGARNPGLGAPPVETFDYEMGFSAAYLETTPNFFQVSGYFFRYAPVGANAGGVSGPALWNPALIAAALANGFDMRNFESGNLPPLTYANLASSWPQWNQFIENNPGFDGIIGGGPNCLITGLPGVNLPFLPYILGNNPTLNIGYGTNPIIGPAFPAGVQMTYDWFKPYLGNADIPVLNYFFNNGGSGQTQWLDPITPGTYNISIGGAYANAAGLFSSTGTFAVYAVSQGQKILLGTLTGPNAAQVNLTFPSAQYFGQNFWYILVEQSNMGGDLSNLWWYEYTYQDAWWLGTPYNRVMKGPGSEMQPDDFNTYQTIDTPDENVFFPPTGYGQFGQVGWPAGTQQQMLGYKTVLSDGPNNLGIPTPGFAGAVSGVRIGP